MSYTPNYYILWPIFLELVIGYLHTLLSGSTVYELEITIQYIGYHTSSLLYISFRCFIQASYISLHLHRTLQVNLYSQQFNFHSQQVKLHSQQVNLHCQQVNLRSQLGSKFTSTLTTVSKLTSTVTVSKLTSIVNKLTSILP